MENLENDIIKNKIDSLHELPDGYMPDLDSKWEILESAMNDPKKKRISMFWPLTVVAASVLVFIGTLFLSKPAINIVQNKSSFEKEIKSGNEIVQNSKVSPDSYRVQNDTKIEERKSVQNSKNRSGDYRVQNSNKNELNKKDKIELIVHEMGVIQSDTIKEISNIILAETKPAARNKKRKFVEINFDAPVQPATVENSPEEKISVRFFAKSNEGSNGSNADGTRLKLQHNF